METRDILDAVVYVTSAGSVLVAGIFFAFSTFVMKALGNLPSDQGIRAMQQINVTVLNPLFFAVFFGTAFGAVVVAGLGGFHPDVPSPAFLIVGGMAYLGGCLFVTGAGNVPLNNALASVDPTSDNGRALWSLYLSRWTRLNHVRTGASLLSAVFLMAAVR